MTGFKVDPAVLDFMALAAGDGVYFLSPWIPEEKHYRGVILWRDHLRIRVRWDQGIEATFTVGRTLGWQLICKL